MITNSDLEKWQKAIQGIEAGEKDLSKEELSAFQVLKELFNNNNFESDTNSTSIKVIKDALPSHNNNRLLKAHLINFVALCENYFKDKPKIKEPEQKQEKPKPQEVKEIKQLHTVEKTQAPKKKKRNVVAIIIAAVILVIAGVVVALFGSVLFDRGIAKDLLIPVSSNGEKWGYINAKGNYVINPQFDDAGFFNDGLAKVKSGGKTGYINTKGAYIIPATFKDGTAFNDGLAFVVADGGYPTCIDKSGNTKFVFNEAEYVSVFSEGTAVFITEDGKYGFVDRAKKITTNPQFKVVGSFSEGKASFYDGEQWGYINTDGSYAINPQFDGAYQFSNGLAAIKQGTTFGYVNKDGKLVINPQFANVSSFSDGLAAAKRGNKYGYINKGEKWVIDSEFERAGDFMGGIAPVYNKGKWGFINRKGKYVINPQFKSVKNKDLVRDEFSFIQSDYYDASAFVKQFLKRYADNSFDGINASTTLLKLAGHTIYGNCVNDISPNNAICQKKIVLTPDISINEVIFYFKEPMYEYVPTYDYWGNQKGTKKGDYNFNVNTTAIAYSFSLIGKAVGKDNALAVALKTEIENLYKLQMKSAKGIHYLYQDDGKLNFAIYGSGSGIAFIVAFSKAGLEMFLREKGINF